MNKTLFFRILMAIAITFATSTGAQAQGLKGLGNKIKDKVGGTVSSPTTDAATIGSAYKVAPEKQPWTLDEAGKIKGTLVDGVLTIQGEGRMKDFTITMHGDNRPWAANKNDIKTIVVEEGITYITSLSFYKCENVTSITLPSTLDNIGNAAFYGCKSLPTITLPKKLNTMTPGRVPNDQGTEEPVGIFEQCTSLTEIKVEDGNEKYKAVDGVLYENFSTAWRLKSYPPGRTATKFIVPDKTPIVLLGAFASCQAIKEVVLPVSCGTIQEVAFKGCTNLESLTMNQATGPVALLDKKAFQGVDMAKIKIIVPSKVLDDYKTRPDYVWRDLGAQFTGK